MEHSTNAPPTPSEYTVQEPGGRHGASSAASSYAESIQLPAGSFNVGRGLSRPHREALGADVSPQVEDPVASAYERLAAAQTAAFTAMQSATSAAADQEASAAAAAAANDAGPRPVTPAITASRAAASSSQDSAAYGSIGIIISALMHAARSQELRSLAVDLTRTSTSAAVGVMHADPNVRQWFRSMMYKLYILASILVFLGVYAASPRFLS